MQIILAQHAGFCCGVKRAIEIAMSARQKAGAIVYVLGHLVHNEAVVAQLETWGVKVIEQLAAAEPCSTVLITAHGLDYRIVQEAQESGFQVIDTTCPIIQKVHRFTRQFLLEGRQIVIIGHPDHIEVKGIMGVAEGKAQIVSRVDDIAHLSCEHLEKLGVVVQTTFNVTKMQEIIQQLKQQFPTIDVAVRQTICPDVMEKQNEIRKLADKVDAVVVVGSKSSSNTTRLYEIAREICPHTYFVSHAAELEVVPLNRLETIIITAGASTPDWIIEEVIKYLKHSTGMEGWQAGSNSFIQYSNLLLNHQTPSI